MNWRTGVVIPVFNRKDLTLECIRHLRALGVLQWVRVFVVDDGSTDGTSDALQAEFPEVEIIRGDGNLWWSGGINRGTEAALAWGAEYIFWLNDDCFPRPGTFEKLLEVSERHRAITCPTTLLLETGEPGFGARRKTLTWVAPVLPDHDTNEPCDTFNGNLVCIPRWVFEKIGLVDQAHIPHNGDYDFGLRASAAGCRILAVGDALCDGKDPPLKNRRSWLFGEVTIKEIWQNNFHPQCGGLAGWSWRLRWRHWGILGVLAQVLQLLRLIRATLVRLILPQSFLRYWFGKWSSTHRRNLATGRWHQENEKSPILSVSDSK